MYGPLDRCCTTVLLSSLIILGLGTTGSADPSETAAEPATINVGEIGDWVMARDNVTLIASRPATGELLYMDSLKGVREKAVELDFAPNRLALLGHTLFASVRGSSLIYSLDAGTGHVNARFKLPGEPIEALVCHREKGLLFAANLNEEIYAIHPLSEAITKTGARGTMLAIDPTEGRFLLTGTNRPGEDFVEVQRDGQASRLRLVTVVRRAAVFKYATDQDELRLIGGNTNAAFGDGGSLAISPGGERFAMAAGGGWRSLTDQRFHYVVAVFETADMETMVGQVDLGAYPRLVVFHPVLNLGAALRHGGADVTIKVFKANSLTDRQMIQLPRLHPAPTKSHRLIFGGRGATLVHYYHDTISFIPIDLSDDERAALDAAQVSESCVGQDVGD